MTKLIPSAVQEQIDAQIARQSKEKLEEEEVKAFWASKRELLSYVYRLVRDSEHPALTCSGGAVRDQFCINVNGDLFVFVNLRNGEVVVSAFSGPEYTITAEMTDTQIWELIAKAMKDKAKKRKPWWRFWE